MFLFVALAVSIFVAAGGVVTLVFRSIQRRRETGQQP